MIRRAAVSALAGTLAALVGASSVSAQLVEYVWDTTKTGAQTWQQAANWAPAGFPNDPLHLANLSRPLGANLNADIGSGVTVAGITLGATAAARTTEISSSSNGLLTFRNADPSAKADFNSSTIVEGGDFLIWQRGFLLGGQTSNANGDADLSTIVDGADYQIWKDEFGLGLIAAKGSAYINSLGTAGSVNTFSANIHLDNEQLAINGTTDVTLNGNLTYAGDAANAGVSAAALRLNRAGQTVTINGGMTMINADALEGNDFSINDTERSQGRLVINGPISGTGDISMGTAGAGVLNSLSTIELNGANTYTGSIRIYRANFLLGSDSAFGVNPGPTADPADDTLAVVRPNVGANLYGTNVMSSSDSRNIRNNMVLGGTLTVRGDHSLTLSGTISQTNNRAIVNLLPRDQNKTLTLSGRINVWEDNEAVERRFEIDGTGITKITGTIHNDPMDLEQPRQLIKRGSGVLIMDMAAGSNMHTGPEIIYQGNMHYTSNDSLGPTIRSYGGAVGVDTGVANNATFAGLIDSTSVGGLMLAASDAAATLDFTGTLVNVANMTVAAPEGPNPYTFNGTIIPANNKYGLGGGTGTLRLPNAQLTGASNRVEIRNGGVVELLGDNTYGGSTTILTKYTETHEVQASLNNSSQANPLQYAEVAPTLVVDKLANGGVASSIGASTSDAANLFIQGSTLKYTGTGDSTNRLFTIGTGGATIDSSGSGALAFSNAGALGRDDADDHLGTLDDFSRNANVLYEVSDTSDVIVGMSVNDPDVGSAAASALGKLANRLAFAAAAAQPAVPAALVTGINDAGTELGLNVNTQFLYKPATRIVFGTVPRTLTLSATVNSGANSLTPVIGNSAAGGVVNIAKTGAGTWVLGGNNTYTGTTSVQGGTLIVDGVQTGGGAYTVAAGATIGGGGTLGGNLTVSGTVDPGAVGALAGTLTVTGNATMASSSTTLIEIGGTGGTQFDQLNMTGTLTAGGVFDVDLLPGYVPAAGHSFDVLDFTTASGAFTLSLPALGGGLGWVTTNLLTTGTISIIGGLATAVPEPSAVLLAGIGLAALTRRRRVATAVARNA